MIVKKLLMLSVVSVLVTGSVSGKAYAASENECAIWLCLPFGFAVPGCDKAHKAMYKRLFEFKGPAPAFNSCSVSADGSSPVDDYKIRTGRAVLMGSYWHGSRQIVPSRLIIDGTWCNQRDTGPKEPLGCISTLSTYRIYRNGVQMGDIYYRNKNGRDYTRNAETGILYYAGTDIKAKYIAPK